MHRLASIDIAELSGYKASQLKKVATPCIDDHQLQPDDLIVKGELSAVCSRIVLKCLYLARYNRPDIYWTVNVLARSVTSWTRACDKRLERLIAYINSTVDVSQHCYVGDPPENCSIGLFADASFAGDLVDSKSTTGELLCLFGPNTFVPITWMCKKQTAVSHSSTEAEVIALDACVRMDGIPILNLWDQVIEILGPNSVAKSGGRKVGGPVPKLGSQRDPSLDAKTEQEILLNVDWVPWGAKPPHGLARMYIFEDNEACIKMIIKGRSPALRHIIRTQRVDLDWLLERLKTDPGMFIKYVGTKSQLADMSTKGSFTAAQWKDLMSLHHLGVHKHLKWGSPTTPGLTGCSDGPRKPISRNRQGTKSGSPSPPRVKWLLLLCHAMHLANLAHLACPF